MLEAADEVPSLDTLAKGVGMSRLHFDRILKAMTGVTAKAYASRLRAHRVREELSRRATITEAIFSCGVNSSERFYAVFSEVLV